MHEGAESVSNSDARQLSTTRHTRSDNALAHLPSGKCTANAAWVALAVTAVTLARATAVAAGHHRARWASLRRKIIDVPARIASTSRRHDLHLPRDRPWAIGEESLWQVATGPPAVLAA